MNFWIITSIRIKPEKHLPASAIQNIQTAMALAERGHSVVLWTARLDADWRGWIEEQFGRTIPASLHFFEAAVAGPEGQKKTPFNSLALRLRNIGRAKKIGGAPNLIISRSPRAIQQMRDSLLIPQFTPLVLEYQYPEWAQLWRSWRQRYSQASLGECKRELRRLKMQELERLQFATAILYASPKHKRLLKQANFTRFADILPSGCAEPDEDPPAWNPVYDVGFVGSLTPENGVHTLLEAMRLLPGASTMIVGDGPKEYVDKLKSVVAQFDGGQRIEFAGIVPVKEIRATMRKCRIGAVPISARSGPEKRDYSSPLKLVEWIAAGVPVVATAVPGILQSVDPVSEVVVVPPDSPQAFADAIRCLLKDPLEQERRRRNAMFVAQKAAFSNRAARIEAMARRLLGNPQ